MQYWVQNVLHVPAACEEPVARCLASRAGHSVHPAALAASCHALYQAVEAVEAAMTDCLDKKASRLPRRLLEDALRTVPAAGPALLVLPLGRAATATTAFRRNEALALVAAILKLSSVSGRHAS